MAENYFHVLVGRLATPSVRPRSITVHDPPQVHWYLGSWDRKMSSMATKALFLMQAVFFSA